MDMIDSFSCHENWKIRVVLSAVIAITGAEFISRFDYSKRNFVVSFRKLVGIKVEKTKSP